LARQVVDRAFRGHSTLILIGDPKQSISAFRGGDIDAYLDAARTAGTRFTLGTNWRSDSVMVDSLQTVLRGAALGDAAIVVHDVDAAHQGHRLVGAPHNEPFRLRVVDRATLGYQRSQNIPIDEVRKQIPVVPIDLRRPASAQARTIVRAVYWQDPHVEATQRRSGGDNYRILDAATSLFVRVSDPRSPR
jgi:exodeoxyribonuclease V beta subunit